MQSDCGKYTRKLPPFRRSCGVCRGKAVCLCALDVTTATLSYRLFFVFFSVDGVSNSCWCGSCREKTEDDDDKEDMLDDEDMVVHEDRKNQSKSKAATTAQKALDLSRTSAQTRRADRFFEQDLFSDMDAIMGYAVQNSLFASCTTQLASNMRTEKIERQQY